jgi:hypothetical protein
VAGQRKLAGHFYYRPINNLAMPNKQIVFSDRLVGLTVQNGLVRMDLAVNAGTAKDKDGKTGQRMEVTTQLVMPLDAFASALAMQQNLLKEVVERGKKAQANKAPSATAPDQSAA